MTLVYPLPFDAWETFKPFAERWVATYRQHDSGYPHRIILSCSGKAPDNASSMFDGLPVDWLDYNGGGIDIGAAQFAARYATTSFIVGMTSRVYFYKPGWLKQLMSARKTFGRGLYGASGTYERSQTLKAWPNPHMRTVFYGMDVEDFRRFPYTVVDRPTAFKFESGEWNYMEWFRERGLPVKMVTWTGCYDVPEWRDFSVPNIFRRGDQSNLLVHDKHSDFYAAANPATKRHLEAVSGDGLVVPNYPVNYAYKHN